MQQILPPTYSIFDVYTSNKYISTNRKEYILIWNCKVTDITTICNTSAIYWDFTLMQYWCWVCSGKFDWTKMIKYELRWKIKDKSGQKDENTERQKDNSQDSEGFHPYFNELRWTNMNKSRQKGRQTRRRKDDE